MVGLYAIVKGFILWATGSEVEADPVQMHGADDMPMDNQNAHQPLDNDNPDGNNPRAAPPPPVDPDARHRGTYYDPGCPTIFFRTAILLG